MEWRIERRRGSSIDRKNTIRHLIQMMAISEEGTAPNQPHAGTKKATSAEADGGMRSNLPSQQQSQATIPPEFEALCQDEELKQILIDIIETANDLDILDFQEFCRGLDNPKPMWQKTQATTGKHVPVY